MNKKFFTPKKVHAYVRAAIQLLFFLFLPSAFTTAFSGIKSVLTQIGTGSPVVMSSFLTVLLALCAYTVVFGRFFCGYACVHWEMRCMLCICFSVRSAKRSPFS